jgi:glycosyltransferase involved in cell wall biosynthesis
MGSLKLKANGVTVSSLKMRIAIVNWSKRRVGGVETYLNTIIPELSRAGHRIAFWHEVDEPIEREQIGLPDDATSWCVSVLGAEQALAALQDWRPDVIYTHKLSDPELERKVLGLAPSVFFAHDYNGTCISGTKTFKYPIVQPCSRRFGWQCLAHYFPHRCGGLSPVTMLKLYGLQSRRLKNLHFYDAIVTHSDHMLAELIKHGLSPQRAYNFPYYVQPAHAKEQPSGFLPLPAASSSLMVEKLEERRATREGRSTEELHLLFSGRMEYLKGGHVFIDALPEVALELAKPLRVTFAGDGRERKALEQRAARVRHPQLKIEFVGWVERLGIEALLEACDLLVVPSLWPEPFGLVGPEAGQFGVPVAAFDVGGIHDWLSDGVNGYLASGTPPTSKGLAQAIIKCLRDPATHARLRDGAVEVSRQFNIKNHLTALIDVFTNVTAHQ